ncbi:MAG: 1-acyl-sn-glycerol-3-phosphate acyltransferase [Myxococcales bacterium]|nr:1-acyl-sn-glycerol-3-phosphate acyltransferase [Myxococcales bacterium]MDH3482815.1 1-acyl-sn-glycerol-3-phosphate acyltransferase [Myxococcales bacterium]
MGIKSTLQWVRTEWGIFRKGGEMGVRERVRWMQQWVPFGARTIGWAVVSLTGGPFSKGRASTWAATRWSRSSAKGLNIAIEADGLDNVPEGGFVYASNHESLVDILILGAVLPGDFKWAAKRSVMNIPFLGWHLRLAGHVPVDRSQGRDAAKAAIEAFTKVLEDGQPLLVFPEGTRTQDGKLRPFKNGAFEAAVETDSPVVPVALRGTFSLMSRDAVDTGSWRDPHVNRLVTVRVGAPLYPIAELSKEDRIADLRDRTREAIIALKERAIPARAVAESAQPL